MLIPTKTRLPARFTLPSSADITCSWFVPNPCLLHADDRRIPGWLILHAPLGLEDRQHRQAACCCKTVFKTGLVALQVEEGDLPLVSTTASPRRPPHPCFSSSNLCCCSAVHSSQDSRTSSQSYQGVCSDRIVLSDHHDVVIPEYGPVTAEVLVELGMSPHFAEEPTHAVNTRSQHTQATHRQGEVLCIVAAAAACPTAMLVCPPA